MAPKGVITEMRHTAQPVAAAYGSQVRCSAVCAAAPALCKSYIDKQAGEGTLLTPDYNLLR
jgi:hypothetical protein